MVHYKRTAATTSRGIYVGDRREGKVVVVGWCMVGAGAFDLGTGGGGWGGGVVVVQNKIL